MPVSRIKDLFSVAGRVTDCDLYLDKEGKSKGIAVIEFAHIFEAVQAISMLHNQRYMDRTLAVRLDQFQPPIPPRGPNDLPDGLRAVGPGLGDRGQPLYLLTDVLSSSNRGLAFENFPPSAYANVDLAPGGFGASLGGAFPGSIGGGGIGGPLMGTMTNVGGFGDGFSGSGGLGSGGSTRDIMRSSSMSGSLNPSALLGFEAGYTSAASESRMMGGRGGGSDSIGTSLGGSGGRGGGSGADYVDDRGGDRYRDYDRPRVADYTSSSSLEIGRGASPRRDAYVSRNSGGGVGSTSSSGQIYLVLKGLPANFNWQHLKDLGREASGEVDYVEINAPGVGRLRFNTYLEGDRARRFLNGYVLEGRPLQCDFE